MSQFENDSCWIIAERDMIFCDDEIIKIATIGMRNTLHNLKITAMVITRKSKVKLKKLNIEVIVNEFFCQKRTGITAVTSITNIPRNTTVIFFFYYLYYYQTQYNTAATIITTTNPIIYYY
jgi:hypothetical protein